MQLITVVTVEAEKGIRWIKSLLCVNELCQVWPGTTASFDMIIQDYVCVCCVQLWSLPSCTHEYRTPNPTRLAFQRGGHLLETSAPFRLSWSTYWTVPRISTHLCKARTCSFALMSPKVNAQASGTCKLTPQVFPGLILRFPFEGRNRWLFIKPPNNIQVKCNWQG